MSDLPKKKARLVSSLEEMQPFARYCTQNLADIEAMWEQQGKDHDDASRILSTAFNEFHTPYGHSLPSKTVPRISGEDFEWWYINPLALIWTLCSLFPAFLSFLKRRTCSADASYKCSMVFYTDKTSPRNKRRPDKTLTVQTLQWSLAEWPAWFRARKHGWLTLSAIRLPNL